MRAPALGRFRNGFARLANQERGLARWDQALGAIGPEGGARLIEGERAEHPAVEEAVLAAAPVLPAALASGPVAPEGGGELGWRLLDLDHVND